MRIIKLAFFVYLLSSVVLSKYMLECKIRYNGCRVMRSDDTFPNFAFILVRRICLEMSNNNQLMHS